MFLEPPDFPPSRPQNLTGLVRAGFLCALVLYGSLADLSACPKNGLLFEVDRTSSLLTSANHPKAVVSLRGSEGLERSYATACLRRQPKKPGPARAERNRGKAAGRVTACSAGQAASGGDSFACGPRPRRKAVVKGHRWRVA